jgi:hypothetical protein
MEGWSTAQFEMTDHKKVEEKSNAKFGVVTHGLPLSSHFGIFD